ncbi:transcriptional repressor TCF25-domain-containing protein [Cercophora newfieldiana]|uniref:Transcriptional repressor TCF25-domain-containing protein n=1 Tax=Cercophora newfieldiana TaxID=92897 RepID=A0AA39YIH1_9PEZI|nr:transcriptional repressor TCF25-domain-containing protein [Cercophora newfieldiana]
MASRQLRKLRQQQDALNLQQVAAESRDSSEEEPQQPVNRRKNVFSAFAALGDDGGDDDDDDEQNSDQDETKPEKSQQAGMDGQADEAPQPKKSKKSKKKKKKGKKPDATPAIRQPAPEPLDDIDQALKELNLAKSQQSGSGASHSGATSSVEQLQELMKINFYHLKAMNEMRKLFGKTIQAVEAETSAAQTNRPQAGNREINLETYLSSAAPTAGPPGRGPKPAMFETALRANPFIEGKKTWPRGSALGLKMTAIGRPDELNEYTFSHETQYDQLESNFFSLVQMYDPMQIVEYLRRNPYHVSSLIQISKYAKHNDQNPVLAADLIERALFSFGRVSLKAFRTQLELGRVFMDFARTENRQFYLAGWNLIQHLVSKGTVRTALEWSKLFLSINHEDPYAMINWVHVLAIRAHKAQWFIDLCKTQLLSETRGLPTSIYIKQTLALAHLQLGNPALAKAALIEGIERLPWLYCAIFSALNLDTPKSIWAVQPRDDDEALHTKLYIHMTKDLWTAPQTTALLAEAAKAAQKVNVSALPKGPEVSLGTARFIYLDNTPNLMSAVPRQMLHQSPNFEFDPLPPPKELNLFSHPSQKRQWAPSDLMGGPLPGFLNDPRRRALLQARAQEQLLADDEEDRRELERLLAGEVAAVGAGDIPADNRGWLGRVLDLMSGGRGGWGFGGADDQWADEDEFEGDDDFGDEDDDDELPDLEEVLSTGSRPTESRRATVEDAEDEEDELPRDPRT